MKIIDAHLHLFPNDTPRPEQLASAVGHHNSTEHLREVHGVVMGNRSLEPDYHSYPADLFHCCLGLDSSLMASMPDNVMAKVKEHLSRQLLRYEVLSRLQQEASYRRAL